MSHAEVEDFIRKADVDGDGVIDYEEFAQMMTAQENEEEEEEEYQVEGWFTLMDKSMLRHGQIGSVHLRMSWLYDPAMDKGHELFNEEEHGDSHARSKKTGTALEQLQMNSNETMLKLGNLLLVSNMIDTFPVLFTAKRITIRNINFFLGDLFRGYEGAAEKGATPQGSCSTKHHQDHHNYPSLSPLSFESPV